MARLEEADAICAALVWGWIPACAGSDSALQTLPVGVSPLGFGSRASVRPA